MYSGSSSRLVVGDTAALVGGDLILVDHPLQGGAIAQAVLVGSYPGPHGRNTHTPNCLIPAVCNSFWQSGGNQMHSDDKAFAEFTGGTDPIPLYDVQAA
jgi:hypothetical protein